MISSETSYKLNGVVIKKPTSFKIERYKVTNAQRLANGNMAADVLARKRKFQLNYAAIMGDELDNILDIIWDNDDYFFDFSYVYNGEEQSAKVYPGSIPSDLHRADGKWVWKNVNISLIEQ